MGEGPAGAAAVVAAVRGPVPGLFAAGTRVVVEVAVGGVVPPAVADQAAGAQTVCRPEVRGPVPVQVVEEDLRPQVAAPQAEEGAEVAVAVAAAGKAATRATGGDAAVAAPLGPGREGVRVPAAPRAAAGHQVAGVAVGVSPVPRLFLRGPVAEEPARQAAVAAVPPEVRPRRAEEVRVGVATAGAVAAPVSEAVDPRVLWLAGTDPLVAGAETRVATLVAPVVGEEEAVHLCRGVT